VNTPDAAVQSVILSVLMTRAIVFGDAESLQLDYADRQ
jgi:hypothetical protein